MYVKKVPIKKALLIIRQTILSMNKSSILIKKYIKLIKKYNNYNNLTTNSYNNSNSIKLTLNIINKNTCFTSNNLSIKISKSCKKIYN
jgi:hypothetical protein